MKKVITLLGLVVASLGKDQASLRKTQSLSYSEDQAFQAHGYAEISNCGTDSSFLNWNCNYCTRQITPQPRRLNRLDNRRVFNGGDDKAILGYDSAEDRIVVAFRNTQDSAQFLTNLDLDLVVPPYCSSCRVGESFLNAFYEVGQDVLDAINDLSNQVGTNDILLTGHSLGGAMMHHCAGFLRQIYGNRFNIVGYTFGAPRVGNDDFADWFANEFPNWFRVVNYNDPIPNIIPRGGENFNHAPQEIWYFNPPNEGQSPGPYRVLSNSNGEDPNGQIQTCDGGNLFKICLNFDHHGTYLNFFSDAALEC
eukprot:snap_masked-scaffold_3-processed-gene-21.48-mRNA-1 protein AED:1.00 eAED:1.00 QI:0/-1/0/0/-1/1/1/0/307